LELLEKRFSVRRVWGTPLPVENRAKSSKERL
jgi:hypothetical protein